MKVPVILVLLFGSALSNLEPPRYRAPSSHYLPANHRRVPSTSNRYVPSRDPSNSYQEPEILDARQTLPSTSYGVPDYNQARSYEYPRYQNQRAEEYVATKYDFGYRVKDGRGNDYGHQEIREGSRTRGSYSVLLPDGRRQIVEYEADEDGFRPRISYESVTPVRYDQPRDQPAYPTVPY